MAGVPIVIAKGPTPVSQFSWNQPRKKQLKNEGIQPGRVRPAAPLTNAKTRSSSAGGPRRTQKRKQNKNQRQMRAATAMDMTHPIPHFAATYGMPHMAASQPAGRVSGNMYSPPPQPPVKQHAVWGSPHNKSLPSLRQQPQQLPAPPAPPPEPEPMGIAPTPVGANHTRTPSLPPIEATARKTSRSSVPPLDESTLAPPYTMAENPVGGEGGEVEYDEDGVPINQSGDEEGIEPNEEDFQDELEPVYEPEEEDSMIDDISLPRRESVRVTEEELLETQQQARIQARMEMIRREREWREEKWQEQLMTVVNASDDIRMRIQLEERGQRRELEDQFQRNILDVLTVLQHQITLAQDEVRVNEKLSLLAEQQLMNLHIKVTELESQEFQARNSVIQEDMRKRVTFAAGQQRELQVLMAKESCVRDETKQRTILIKTEMITLQALLKLLAVQAEEEEFRNAIIEQYLEDYEDIDVAFVKGRATLWLKQFDKTGAVMGAERHARRTILDEEIISWAMLFYSGDIFSSELEARNGILRLEEETRKTLHREIRTEIAQNKRLLSVETTNTINQFHEMQRKAATRIQARWRGFSIRLKIQEWKLRQIAIERLEDSHWLSNAHTNPFWWQTQHDINLEHPPSRRQRQTLTTEMLSRPTTTGDGYMNSQPAPPLLSNWDGQSNLSPLNDTRSGSATGGRTGGPSWHGSPLQYTHASDSPNMGAPVGQYGHRYPPTHQHGTSPTHHHKPPAHPQPRTHHAYAQAMYAQQQQQQQMMQGYYGPPGGPQQHYSSIQQPHYRSTSASVPPPPLPPETPPLHQKHSQHPDMHHQLQPHQQFSQYPQQQLYGPPEPSAQPPPPSANTVQHYSIPTKGGPPEPAQRPYAYQLPNANHNTPSSYQPNQANTAPIPPSPPAFPVDFNPYSVQPTPQPAGLLRASGQTISSLPPALPQEPW
eukprot:TRINITY_DN66220_c0_g1_i1.p1 TRINITY_DN66220_c0_g1~~TRINITY_DN66220_c0_g1_i1.p1  ORF type:complete len:941 (-),score=122.25 TRINITY_DN66220_c0_g1_i1:1159-3981(-)